MDIRNRFFGKKDKKYSTAVKEKVAKLMEKEGFYIILFLCVCIVIFTAVWVTKTNIKQLQMSHMKNIEQPIENTEEASGGLLPDISEEDIIEDPIDVIEENETEINNQNIESVSEEVFPVEKSSNIMRMPVKGRIGMDFAADTLTYSKTLEQYTTHHGIDIIAPESTPVVAALDGEVIEVTVDSRLGTTIALAHEGNIITRYANLSTTEMVKIGDYIEKGQTISGVGSSALFEKAEEPHLHFEVLVDGEPVDPKKHLPIQ
jgi:murein DD-endopeptidase MepM/ murein hydrolase activator NlpD